MNKAFAEVIEGSLNSWRAQCWDWKITPIHGSVLTITTEDRTLYGLVHDISTGSIDSHRSVYTYKKSDEELRRDHPHIFELLHTTFSCLMLGYEEKGKTFYQPAPSPPAIHAFVVEASDAQLKKFFSREQYLHTLFAHAQTIFSLDDTLLALLKYLSERGILHEDNLSGFMETFSLLTANDYRRLKLFLQRTETILGHLHREDTLHV
jgi:hypothetical protein